MISPNAVFRRPDEVRFRLVAGEAVVVRQRAAEVLGLNTVASRIYEWIDGTTPVSGLVERLAASFPAVSRERLEADVAEFLAELLASGLVEPAVEER